MTTLTCAQRVIALPDIVNSRAWLTRLGRHCSVDFVVQTDDQPFYIAVRGGRMEAVEPGPALLRSHAFAIRGPSHSWQKFMSPLPPRGFHDLFAMTTYGHVQVDGDLGPLLTHLPYFKGVLAALRDTDERTLAVAGR